MHLPGHHLSALSLWLIASGCASDKVKPRPSEGEDSSVIHEDDTGTPVELDRFQILTVMVTVDGEPTADVQVVQPGGDDHWLTGSDGRANVVLDRWVEGTWLMAASHPEARIKGVTVVAADEEVAIALTRFDPVDNVDFLFQDPGTPERNETANFCSHCHVTLVVDWWDSLHRTAASNPRVQDQYAGTVSTLVDEASCVDAGGQWWVGIIPGTGEPGERCYRGGGVLPDLNLDCGDTESCDGVAEQTGRCADCHAPGIDGVVGGRDLLEATGVSYEGGVHCDVCHRVETVDLESPLPGVGGRLILHRPMEPAALPGMGEFEPLTFGPFADVVNPRMGSVQRDHFTSADLCAGCHEYMQPALLPGSTVETTRWPDGLIPVHTTYTELKAGSLGEGGIACQSCHMPPDADVGNSADLENVFDLVPGITGGWYRPAGAVRRHVWFGPRHGEQRMLELAATLDLEAVVEGGDFVVQATVRNSGPGHAIPTGEPSRSILLLVEARCDGERLVPTGGSAVPDFGGALAQQDTSGDWTVWPEATVGERIRVVRRDGTHLDYTGWGPFGDGRFDAVAKGMWDEAPAGEVTITAVSTDGSVTLDGPLPEGDMAYRVAAVDTLPDDEDPAGTWAGSSGFGFARIMVGPEGERNVPHYRAVDVASDNRLLPGASWTTEHRFATSCADPETTAKLIYRRAPLGQRLERDWVDAEPVMAEARR